MFILLHRNNSENYIENKVAIIAVIIITSACFLYFPNHFIPGIKTNHNNSYKTALFGYSQLFQIPPNSPGVSTERVTCIL